MTAKEEADKKDIVKGASVNFIGFLVRLSSRLPYILLVVALFGNALYGRLIFITTIVELGAALSVFGFKRSLFKFIVDKKYSEGHTTEEVILAALASTFTIGLLLIGVIFLLADQLAIWFNYPEMVKGLLFLAPVLLLISANEVLLAGTRVSRDMKYEAIAKSFVEPYVLLSTMLLFYFLDLGEMGLLLSYGISITATLLTAIWGCSRLYHLKNVLTARPNFSLISRMAKFSAPTAFHDLALLFFMRMDIFTVKFFFAEGILGVYNIAQQITTSVEKIYQSFYPILAPVMAKNLVEKDYDVVERQMVMVSRWTLIVQCILVIIALFYGESFMGFISNDNTENSVLAAGGVVLVFLMIGETINGGFGMTDMPILYLRPIFNPIISLLIIPVYVMIAWVFVRLLHFDISGVAIALCSAYFIMNLIRVIIIKRLIGINMIQASLLRVVLAAIGCSFIFHLIITPYSPLDLTSGYGIAVGVTLIMVIYWSLIITFCLTARDKTKFLKKFTKSK